MNRIEAFEKPRTRPLYTVVLFRPNAVVQFSVSLRLNGNFAYDSKFLLKHRTTSVDAIEELEKRKKELQLRHDIAKLERGARIRDASSSMSAKSSSWNWWWVAPLGILGLVWAVAGAASDGKQLAIIPGLLCVVPFLLKVLNVWGAKE